jgi:hypothetical protein
MVFAGGDQQSRGVSGLRGRKAPQNESSSRGARLPTVSSGRANRLSYAAAKAACDPPDRAAHAIPQSGACCRVRILAPSPPKAQPCDDPLFAIMSVMAMW